MRLKPVPRFSYNLVRTLLSFGLLTFLGVPIANAWFIFIPGSVTSAISDAITGDRGEHCVTRGAQVGDVVSDVAGGRWRVESVSGESIRCGSDKPIRAMLVPLGAQQAPRNETIQKSSSVLPGRYVPSLGSEWRQLQVSASQKDRGVSSRYAHISGSWELNLQSASRVSYALSAWSFANFASTFPHGLKDFSETPIQEIEVEGKTIYLRERQGNDSTNGMTRLLWAVFATDDDYVLLEQRSPASEFDSKRERMMALLRNLALGRSVSFDQAAPSGALSRETVDERSSVNDKAERATPPVSTPQIGSDQRDVASRLQKLRELYEKGLITSSEYESKRSEILKSL